MIIRWAKFFGVLLMAIVVYVVSFGTALAISEQARTWLTSLAG